MNKAKRYEIFSRLQKDNPHPTTELKFSSNFELLIAVILSAQATDKSVNLATEKLYAVANTPEAIFKLGEAGLKKYIKTIGLYNSKAKNIINTCRILIEEHNSTVPDDQKKLEALPGVGRKTANIVLSNAFGVIEGIAVDTHVRRLAKRLGLTKHDDPNKIERDLMEIVPKDKWMRIADLLIFHGRRICAARKPECKICVLNRLCPSAFTFGQVQASS